MSPIVVLPHVLFFNKRWEHILLVFSCSLCFILRLLLLQTYLSGARNKSRSLTRTRLLRFREMFHCCRGRTPLQRPSSLCLLLDGLPPPPAGPPPAGPRPAGPRRPVRRAGQPLRAAGPGGGVLPGRVSSGGAAAVRQVGQRRLLPGCKSELPGLGNQVWEWPHQLQPPVQW